ncbi:hypothetical protein SGLAM104S_04654 [Streptomyces glaucescens]
MPGRHRQHMLVLVEGDGLHTGRPLALRQPEEREVQLPLPDLRHQVVTAPGPQDDLDLRVPGPVPPEHVRHVHGGGGHDHADGEPATDHSGRGGGIGDCPLGGGQTLPRADQERRPGTGQLHPAAGPGEQPDPQLPFQPGDPVTERRLHHEQRSAARVKLRVSASATT